MMELMDAAELAKDSYKGASKLPPVRVSIEEGHVQAYLLKDGTLVVRGSDQAADYYRTNLVASKVKLSWTNMDARAGKARWHKGFTRHATTINRHLGLRRPKMIVGHSLGGAVAQILGCIYAVPAIGFASPRPVSSSQRFMAEKRILNVLRNDDIVCRVPSTGYRWVGNSEVMHPKKKNIGEDHSMPNYIHLMKSEIKEGKLVKRWPLRR